MSTDVNTDINPQMHFSSESQYDEKRLNQFWHQVTQAKLPISADISLAYCYINHPQSDKAIVISSGRIESYLKYKETIFDLYHLGYSVYAVDHRGQGLSSRLTTNPHQGHVGKFEDYIDDFEYFIDTVVTPAAHTSLFLLGHSMGSAIATLYLKRAPKTFKAAVLSAPMYGIRLPIHPHFIYWLAKLLDNGSAKEPNFVIGGKNYHPAVFEQNELTHSQVRYQQFRMLYQQRPELQLGSPTNHWLQQAIIASRKALIAAQQSTTPILILQAEYDSIVDNNAQTRAISEHCKLVTIANARHEIFIEKDAVRDEALSRLDAFFSSHY
ncbi:alpha/beta fold hydrolase [Shewanella sp. Isolate11]|uniref:alpha/beta fold hydrolase n=1 Tax=Shewanella sp. Isolate11 TaxID=2908530 RepID=UPI001EFD645D|nr:alpha/beta fold hydrolase [Shewanella sp. Isolate11]MCG9697997.1 alpha/beta fold hydrolase [Shewanella sp. Isolate11]